MVKISTNVSSLIVQRGLKSSTNGLNQAIERMSTGYKINQAKDNAANCSIVDSMSVKISSLDVASENTAMSMDMVSTAQATLEIISNRLDRLRELAIQAQSDTYGADSREAINAECVALVREIQRTYANSEYNNIQLYGLEDLLTLNPTADGTVVADLTTTFESLGINNSSFEIRNGVLFQMNPSFPSSFRPRCLLF